MIGIEHTMNAFNGTCTLNKTTIKFKTVNLKWLVFFSEKNKCAEKGVNRTTLIGNQPFSTGRCKFDSSFVQCVPITERVKTRICL